MPPLIELVEFNQRLLDFRRAGWHLPAGLLDPGQRPETALRHINEAIAQDALTGATLAQTLESKHASITPAYRDLVRIGLKCGELNDALECLPICATSSHRLRNRLIAGLTYPLFLIVLAGSLLGFTVMRFLPTVTRFVHHQNLDPIGLSQVVVAFRSYSGVLSGVAALIVIVVLYLLMRLYNAAQTSGWATALTRYLPGGGELRRWQQLAAFSRVSSWLLGKQFSTSEAYRYAAELNDVADLRAAFDSSAIDSARLDWLRTEAPLLHWVLTAPHAPHELAALLQETSDAYDLLIHRRWQQWIRYVPLTLVVGLGGVLTLAYVYSVMGALVQLIQQLV